MRIRFHGSTGYHSDTLFGTRAVWSHPGDVQEVDDKAGEKMVSMFPQVYEVAHEYGSTGYHSDTAELAKPADDYQTIRHLTADGMSIVDAPLDALRRFADDIGLATADWQSREDILSSLVVVHESEDVKHQ